MEKTSTELLISSNTLYYFFSTVAQVLAATSALSAIFIQVKINAIKKFLVGTGKAMLNRIGFNEEGYRELESIHKLRLRDSVDKEDLDGVEDILGILTKKEIEKGIKKENHPTGFQGINEKYVNQKELIESLNKLMKVAILYSLITIFASVICLGLVDLINDNLFSTIASTVVILFLITISLWKTYKVVTKGLG